MIEERHRFVLAYLGGEHSMAELCGRFQVSRPTGYKWVERYRKEGLGGLTERSHRPRQCPQALDPQMQTYLFAVRHQHPTWGPKKLLAWMARVHPEWPRCAPSTAGQWLWRAGLSPAREVRRKNVIYADPLGGDAAVNDVWCIDFKGPFRLGNGGRCVPLTLSDGHSRFLLRCTALARPELPATRRVLEGAFREYGLPQRLRSDNGAPLAAWPSVGSRRWGSG